MHGYIRIESHVLLQLSIGLLRPMSIYKSIHIFHVFCASQRKGIVGPSKGMKPCWKHQNSLMFMCVQLTWLARQS